MTAPAGAALVRCPGCGVELPQGGWLDDGRQNASPECVARCGDLTVLGLELVAGATHQLIVDAYGAQHAGPPTKPIRVAYSLVGLYLQLEQDWTGPQVRALHQRMGRPQPDWPGFKRPARTTALTVQDVARRSTSAPGHRRAVTAWAADVWAVWAQQHDAVIALAELVRRG